MLIYNLNSFRFDMASEADTTNQANLAWSELTKEQQEAIAMLCDATPSKQQSKRPREATQIH